MEQPGDMHHSQPTKRKRRLTSYKVSKLLKQVVKVVVATTAVQLLTLWPQNQGVSSQRKRLRHNGQTLRQQIQHHHWRKWREYRQLMLHGQLQRTVALSHQVGGNVKIYWFRNSDGFGHTHHYPGWRCFPHQNHPTPGKAKRERLCRPANKVTASSGSREHTGFCQNRLEQRMQSHRADAIINAKTTKKEWPQKLQHDSRHGRAIPAKQFAQGSARHSK